MEHQRPIQPHIPGAIKMAGQSCFSSICSSNITEGIVSDDVDTYVHCLAWDILDVSPTLSLRKVVLHGEMTRLQKSGKIVRGPTTNYGALV